MRDYTNGKYVFNMKNKPESGWFMRVLHRLLNVFIAVGMVMFASTFCGVMVTLLNILANAVLVPLVEFMRRCGIWEVAGVVSNPIN